MYGRNVSFTGKLKTFSKYDVFELPPSPKITYDFIVLYILREVPVEKTFCFDQDKNAIVVTRHSKTL